MHPLIDQPEKENEQLSDLHVDYPDRNSNLDLWSRGHVPAQ